MPIFINKTKINNVTNQSPGATNVDDTTGKLMTLSDISKHIYDSDEIKGWRMNENNKANKEIFIAWRNVCFQLFIAKISG